MGEHLAQELRAHPTEVLYLTGHSLGGAAAILTAARLSDMGVRPEQLRVITFGSPAVGNVAFARYYEKRMQLTRIVMDGDPVAAALQSLGTRYVQFGERVAWKQDRSSARFEHAMVVYLDRALRLYFSEDEVGDGDMLESRSLAARGGIFVAVPQLDLDPLVAGDDAADIRILQGAWQARYAPCTVQSDGQRGADMDVLIAEARAAQCRYAVRQHVSVKRSRDEADTVRVVLETSVYDAQGTFITVVSKSTTDRRMTPLEAVAYLQFATLRDLDTVFVTQNT